MQNETTRPEVRLIVHADDAGLCRGVNEATFAAMERGRVSSASLMATCPGFAEAADYARRHPQFDWGVHLTMTSEWPALRWGPVAGDDRVQSLLAPDGGLWPDVFSFVQHARLDEVEIEIRSQVDAVLAAGVRPSHLDSHMFALFRNRALEGVLERVSRDYGVPRLALAAGQGKAAGPVLLTLLLHGGAGKPSAVSGLAAGLYQAIVHCGYDNEESRAIMGQAKVCGALWRQMDFDALMSDRFRDELREAGVELVDWRCVAAPAAMRGAA